MPVYVDTVLKSFPFAQASQVAKQMQSDLKPKTEKNPFDFNYYTACIEDSDVLPGEDLEEIDSMLLEELGSTLDDIH